MKIALLHYHLTSGGVATVVRQQARAIRNDCRVCILTGEANGPPPPADTCILPRLAYSKTPFDPESVADEILSTLKEKIGGPCDVLHVHNPTLAKNVSLLKILKALQRRGIRLLLQIHDFAEDGRPGVYTREDYPENCHWAAINSRDYRILQLAGLSPQGVHLLPNMVTEPQGPELKVPGAPLVLYPVRAIRRKNIGEAALLSLFLPAGCRLGITLPPNGPEDRASYNRWKAFAKAHRLRIEFDLGLRHGFDELMQTAKYVISTSIAEGFGFSFLEPWIYGKALLGRKLPDICMDFEAKGIALHNMYTRLRTPLAWFDRLAFSQEWLRHLQRSAYRYGIDLPVDQIQRAYATLTATGDIDFGLLDESTQQIVIGRLSNHSTLRERMLAHNPFLGAYSESEISEEFIKKNRQVVMASYSEAQYRRKLLDVYAAVSRMDVSHAIDKAKIVNAFLHPPDCSMLRWEL